MSRTVYRVWNRGRHTDYANGDTALQAVRNGTGRTVLTVDSGPRDRCPGCPCGWTGDHSISAVRTQTGDPFTIREDA